jgi:AP-1 complex subunit beta-1
MYWRLLTSNADLAKHVVLSERPTISDDSFSTQPRLLERLIGNICSLASVYHQVPDAFIVAPDRKKEEEEEDSDEDEDDDEDRGEKLDRINNQMRMNSRKQYEEESGDEDSGGSSGSSSGSETGGQSRKNGSGGAPPPPLRPVSVVLDEKTAGQNGARGLKIAAAVVRMPGGKVGVQMTVGNFTPQPMGGWAIRFNKNAFGFANTAEISIPELAPNGGTANTVLPIAPNKANSGTPPTNPLYIEIAIKTNVDVFYFSLGFDLSAVLTDGGPVSQDSFKDIWGRLPPERKARSIGQLSQPVSSEMLITRMRQYFCYFVVQREAPDCDLYYFSCSTSNRFQVYCELGIQKNGPGIKMECACEAPPLVPLFQSYLSEVLKVKWQG